MKITRREGLLALITAPVAVLIAEQELEHDGAVAFQRLYPEYPEFREPFSSTADSIVTIEAGEPLKACQLVSLNRAGDVVRTISDAAVVGVAMSDANPGQFVQVLTKYNEWSDIDLIAGHPHPRAAEGEPEYTSSVTRVSRADQYAPERHRRF